MKRLDIKVTLDDQSEHKVQTRTSDYVAYETEAKKRGWGTVATNPSTWEAFVAHRAMRRDGAFTGTFDEFVRKVEDIEVNFEADQDVEPLPTTQ